MGRQAVRQYTKRDGTVVRSHERVGRGSQPDADSVTAAQAAAAASGTKASGPEAWEPRPVTMTEVSDILSEAGCTKQAKSAPLVDVHRGPHGTTITTVLHPGKRGEASKGAIEITDPFATSEDTQHIRTNGRFLRDACMEHGKGQRDSLSMADIGINEGRVYVGGVEVRDPDGSTSQMQGAAQRLMELKNEAVAAGVTRDLAAKPLMDEVIDKHEMRDRDAWVQRETARWAEVMPGASESEVLAQTERAYDRKLEERLAANKHHRRVEQAHARAVREWAIDAGHDWDGISAQAQMPDKLKTHAGPTKHQQDGIERAHLALAAQPDPQWDTGITVGEFMEEMSVLAPLAGRRTSISMLDSIHFAQTSAGPRATATDGHVLLSSRTGAPESLCEAHCSVPADSMQKIVSAADKHIGAAGAGTELGCSEGTFRGEVYNLFMHKFEGRPVQTMAMHAGQMRAVAERIDTRSIKNLDHLLRAAQGPSSGTFSASDFADIAKSNNRGSSSGHGLTLTAESQGISANRKGRDVPAASVSFDAFHFSRVASSVVLSGKVEMRSWPSASSSAEASSDQVHPLALVPEGSSADLAEIGRIWLVMPTGVNQ